MHVHKPKFRKGGWFIYVTRTISPLSDVVETVQCGSYAQAFGEYKRLLLEKDVKITISANVMHETDKAYLLHRNHMNTAWVPKSKVINHKDGTFTLSLAFAIEKGID